MFIKKIFLFIIKTAHSCDCWLQFDKSVYVGGQSVTIFFSLNPGVIKRQCDVEWKSTFELRYSDKWWKY